MNLCQLSVDVETMKAEKVILEESLISIRRELQTLKDFDREIKLKDAKFIRLEVKYNKAFQEFDERVNELENDEKARSDTVEELVSEYSKLAAEVERERNDDKSNKLELQRTNETLRIKVTALEQAISAFADKSTLASTNQGSLMGGEKALTSALSQIDELTCQLAMIESDLSAAVVENMHITEQPSNTQRVLNECNSSELMHKVQFYLSTTLMKTEKLLKDTKVLLSGVIGDKKVYNNMSAREKQLLEGEFEKNSMEKEESQGLCTGNFSIVALQHERDEAIGAVKVMKNTVQKLKHEESNSRSLINSMKQQIEHMKSDIELIKDEKVRNVIELRSNHDLRIQNLLDEHEKELKLLNSSALLRQSTDHDGFLTSSSAHDEEILALHESLNIAREDALKSKAESEDFRNDLVSLKRERDSTVEKITSERVNSVSESEKILSQKVKELDAGIFDAVNKAVDENTRELTDKAHNNIESLREKLNAEYTRKEMECICEGAASTDKALAELEAKLLEERNDALMSMKKASEEKLNYALETLKISKDEEIRVAVEHAEKRALELLDSSLKTQVEKGKAEVEAMRLTKESILFEAEKARDTAKRDLANVEERFLRREMEALTLKESEVRSEMQVLVNAANKEATDYMQLYTKENKLRKTIHNKLLELQGNIRVFCRVRPILEMERKVGEDIEITSFPTDEDLIIQRDTVTKTQYEYDHVFRPTATQEEVFKQVQPYCVSVLDGFNICIFAYGQTGSGKTYTMEGSDSSSIHSGISPRAVYEIFRLIDNVKDTWEYIVNFSVLEIYNETIRDLLISPDNTRKNVKTLDVRQTSDGNSIPGLTEEIVCSPEQVYDLMKNASRNRAVGSHEMNTLSSRSHSIVTMVCKGICRHSSSSTYGKLNLIDLAGSERVSKTDAAGERLKEAQNINRSLSALGDVINALGNKKSTHVPYRNSKLTFLLQDSLGGNSKCLMFVNISPAVYNLSETTCSLNFAARCRNVELGTTTKQSSAGVSKSDSSSNGGGKRVCKVGSMASSKK